MQNQKLHAAYEVILDHLRSNTKDTKLLDNFKGTEARCVKALLETCKADDDIAETLKHIVDRQFPVNHPSDRAGGMVTQGPITVHSTCPHHLFPVVLTAYVSYLPKDGKVLGLSKLARICKALGERPVLHEQLANDIADVLCFSESSAFPGVESNGSAVMLVGKHMCMSCRGVKENAMTSVMEMRGGFRTDVMENKFYQSVHSIKSLRSE